MQHDIVFNQVLPYIISQKTDKLWRKGASIVPGVGLLEGVRAVGKKAYKYAAGTLGVERKSAAQWLGVPPHYSRLRAGTGHCLRALQL